MGFKYDLGLILFLLILLLVAVPLLLGVGLALALRLTGAGYYGTVIIIAGLIWAIMIIYLQK